MKSVDMREHGLLIDIVYEEWPYGGDYVYNLQLITNRCTFTPDMIDTEALNVEPPLEMNEYWFQTLYFYPLEYLYNSEGINAAVVGQYSVAPEPQPTYMAGRCSQSYAGYVSDVNDI